MKVILLTDVKNQGKKGEIREVKDGYGTFLINNKKALPANAANLKQHAYEEKKAEEKHDADVKEAEKVKKKLEKEELNFKLKVGDNDKVFGSITAKAIAEELNKLNYNVNKNKINLKRPLTTLGVHRVEVELHKEVKGEVTINISK